MSIKTFSDAVALPASDINTYLANSGLVYVSSGSFTAATLFDITGFSSTYNYYRLEFRAQRVDTTGASTIYAQLYNGATVRSTAYYASAFFSSYLGATGVGYTSNNASSFFCGTTDSAGMALHSFDIQGMTSGNFVLTGNFWDTGNARQYMLGASHNATETNDKIRMTITTGTATGNWRLYGYREP